MVKSLQETVRRSVLRHKEIKLCGADLTSPESLVRAACHASKHMFTVKCLLRLGHACVLVGVICITRLKFDTFFVFLKIQNAGFLLVAAKVVLRSCSQGSWGEIFVLRQL